MSWAHPAYHAGLPAFRPWIAMMGSINAQSRILADDIMVTAKGAKHEETFADAFEKTNQYIKDMGGCVVAEKTIIYSTNTCTRKRFASRKWDTMENLYWWGWGSIRPP